MESRFLFSRLVKPGKDSAKVLWLAYVIVGAGAVAPPCGLPYVHVRTEIPHIESFCR